MKEFHETLSTIQNCILYLMDHIYYPEAGMYITVIKNEKNEH